MRVGVFITDIHPHELTPSHKLAPSHELTSPATSLAAATSAAESSRDAVLAGVSAADARKASILAAAAIAGVKVKQLAFALDAVSATAACESAFAKMQLDSALGACDATVAASGRRRPRLRRTTSR